MVKDESKTKRISPMWEMRRSLLAKDKASRRQIERITELTDDELYPPFGVPEPDAGATTTLPGKKE